MRLHDEMDDGERVEARLRALEARVTGLETALTGVPDKVPVAAPQVAPIVGPPQVAPVAAPPTPAAAPLPTGSYWEVAGRPQQKTGPTVPAVATRPPWAQVFATLEEQLTGRALAVVGGTALVVGAIFFLSLAFSRGWIGPEARVLIGIGAAGLALGLGAWLLDHRQPIVGRVLVAVGLAVISLSMFAATRLYGLFPVELALLATLVAAVVAAFLAVRNDAQIIAVLALVAILAAPPVLGASPTLVTVAYLGTVLVGFAALALYRTWRWLPSIAFLLSAPQLASWLIGDASPSIGLAAAIVFWVLNIVAAGGEEYLHPRNRLRTGGAMLLLANAAFLVWAGLTVLDGHNEPLRGPFLVFVALGHLLVGGWFLLREGDRHPFGLLAAATGFAALAMAAPIQFGGPPVPIAWAAQGTALAWLASRRAHPQAAIGAAALGTLALAHLLVFEYPLAGASLVGTTAGWPFVNASGLSLAFLLGAAGAAAWFVRTRAVVATIGAVATLAVANAVPHELRGPALVAAWVVLALGAIAFDRYLVDRLPADGPPGLRLRPELHRVALAAAAIIAAVIVLHVNLVDLPTASFGRIRPPAVPFSDDPALTLVILVGATAFSGWIYLRRSTLELPAVASLVGAGLILAYGSVYEVYADAAIVIAACLAALGFALGRASGVDRTGWLLATGASIALVGLGTVAALGVVASPQRLTLGDTAVIDHPPFVSGATAAFGALAAALAVALRLNRQERFAPWLGLGAGVLVVYLLSIGVVDLFQTRIPGPIAFEELATQAQVALSVLWVVLGAIVFIFGLARRHLVVRQAGLLLLALASFKVFVFDLASLDVAYRVLSLVALGTLLLFTAWVYARLRPASAKPPKAPEPEPEAT